MLFNFQLLDVNKIQPWGNDHHKRLHWFGLTDGLYWMNVGADELFRYTEQVLPLMERETELPYVEYYVVRLWEDLLEILPNILEPIPDSILQRIDFGANLTTCHNKIVNYLLLQDNHDLSPQSQDTLQNTTEWMEKRFLDTGHLKQGPQIVFCSDGQKMFIHWNNRGLTMDNIPVWTAEYGTSSLPINQFIESVQSFDKNLMDEMHSRVDEIQRNWQQPEIYIDIPHLLQEQKDRSTWLEQALEKASLIKTSPWHEIEAMLEKID